MRQCNSFCNEVDSPFSSLWLDGTHLHYIISPLSTLSYYLNLLLKDTIMAWTYRPRIIITLRTFFSMRISTSFSGELLDRNPHLQWRNRFLFTWGSRCAVKRVFHKSCAFLPYKPLNWTIDKLRSLSFLPSTSKKENKRGRKTFFESFDDDDRNLRRRRRHEGRNWAHPGTGRI